MSDNDTHAVSSWIKSFPHFAVETVLLLSSPYWTFNRYSKTAHGLVKETGLITYILRYSDFIASRQRFRRFSQMKRKWWMRYPDSNWGNDGVKVRCLTAWLYLNIYVLLFPTNIVYHKSKSFSTQFLWFTFNMYKAKSCLVYAVI